MTSIYTVTLRDLDCQFSLSTENHSSTPYESKGITNNRRRQLHVLNHIYLGKFTQPPLASKGDPFAWY